MNKYCTAVLLLILMAPAYAYAGQCEYISDIEDGFIFPETIRSGDLLAEKLCLIALDKPVSATELKRAADLWRKATLSELDALKKGGADLAPQVNQLYAAFLDDNPAYGNFEMNRQNLKFSVDGQLPIGQLNDELFCSETYAMSCRDVLIQLEKAFDVRLKLATHLERESVYETLGLYSSQWTKYFTEARSQTFLELAVNTRLNKKQYNRKDPEPVPPPEYQLILLHPNIVLESVPDAKDGDQLKEALALELIGFNRWNASTPYGASITAVYSDRADVDDLGVGLMFHVNNSYSFGVTKRDDETGYFISIDLLKFFESKQQNLRAMKEQVDKIRAMHN